MVNLDYTEPIDDDDIIGWKSDRGWVYLTLLGVRPPKNKIPQSSFNGAVKKIVIDDFDESTQIAILLKKPILGYDIINSKTSPSTIVFIHTEMRRSEVASLKRHIKKDGTSVFNIARSSGFPKYNTNFKNAFDEARKELGPNAIFEYHGKLYTTNHPGEKEALTRSVLMKKSIAPVKDGKVDEFVLRNMAKKNPADSLFDELYIEPETGEILAEKIEESKVIDANAHKDNEFHINDRNKNQKIDKEDDGWFSGIFPSYKKTKKKSPIALENELPKDTIIIKEKPIEKTLLAKENKKKKWKDVFKIFRKKKKVLPNYDGLEEEKPLLSTETSLQSEKNLFDFQKRFIPKSNQDIKIKAIEEDPKISSKTQSSDSNVVSIKSREELLRSNYLEFQQLQKQHIPRYLELINDTLPILSMDITPTQGADTNVVEAWFTDESLISDEYDVTRLQKEYIPSRRKNLSFNATDDLNVSEAMPQVPEFIDQSVLDKKIKTRYTNKEIIGIPRKKNEKIFEADSVEENTWLSYFPQPDDSLRSSLKLNLKQEREIPEFLYGYQKEALDYSSLDNEQYRWRDELPLNRPESFPKRQTDPGFMFYRNSGIRIDSNLDGVPIYVDGKYVGDTPISKPIQVEPGWHQVSGFSPMYTKLRRQNGMRFVSYDSIIQNNESFGATTVYAESGKLEVVELRFNQMGDKPKKLREITGGVNVGLPFFAFLISMVLYSM
tara:strand:+ start:5 stop:2164 length:2160 start_codon:yes stop_codon:yes gene_type:complete